MAKIIDMHNMSAKMAARVLQALNGGEENVEIRWHRSSTNKSFNHVGHPVCLTIVTDISPEDLNYPEGWYFEEGCLCNRRYTTNITYSEVYMEKFDGTPWNGLVDCVDAN